MGSHLDCIQPPSPDKKRPLQVLVARELKSIYEDCLQGITPIARERIENIKTIQKGLDKGKLPGNRINIIKGSDLSEIIITNGVDSLFVRFGDDVFTPMILLDGIVGRQDGNFIHHTFDVDNITHIAEIAICALKLLEIYRYPDRFSLKKPTFSISTEGKLEITDNKTKVITPYYLRNIPKEHLTDILSFVNQLIQNIPKEPLTIQDDSYTSRSS